MSIQLKNTNEKIVYTVFLEPEIGDWAWVKEAGDETMYVGSCVTFGKHWEEEYPISDLLLEMVDAWIKSVLMATESDLSIDWDAFNAEGLTIAKQLKVELGDDVAVRYVKAVDDPSYIPDEGFEVLKDGTILPIKRLWWSPI
jgi:hypothetical protein